MAVKVGMQTRADGV